MTGPGANVRGTVVLPHGLGRTKRVLAIAGGFVEVLPDRVTVLAQIAERPLDECVRRSEIAARIEQPIERLRIEQPRNLRLPRQNVAQMSTLRRGSPTGACDERMCGVAPELRRERHLHRFRKHQSLRDLQVLPHSLRVDFESLRHLDHRAERAGGGASSPAARGSSSIGDFRRRPPIARAR